MKPSSSSESSRSLPLSWTDLAMSMGLKRAGLTTAAGGVGWERGSGARGDAVEHLRYLQIRYVKGPVLLTCLETGHLR
jgi:hypothetical protein